MKARIYAALILAAGIAVYANSLNRPFILDDQSLFDYNTQIREWPHLKMFDVPEESPVAGRPLPNLSFAINYTLGKENPIGYHAVNLALHLACALMLFGLVRGVRPGSDPWSSASDPGLTPAFAVALIWVVHPLNTEVVDYLMQRTESMMALFYLLTLYAAARGWSVVAVLACAAGMASKESMVSAPIAVALYDRCFLFASWRDAFRARWKLYVGLAATWGVLAALMVSSPRTFSAGFTNIHVSSWTYFLNQMPVITRYLRLAIWPTDLVVFYGWTLPLTVADVLPYALFLFALLGATIVALVRKPALGYLGAFVALTLAPSSSVAPIAAEVAAERRMYLPLMAIVVLGVVAVDALLRSWRPPSGGRPAKAGHYVLLGAITLALGTLTVLRNREYASSLVMAQTVIDRWPTPVAHDMIGTALTGAGRHDEAVAHFREAERTYAPARYNLGAELLNMGRVDEAAPFLQSYASEQPRDVRARSGRIALGRAFEGIGQPGRAVVEYEALVDARPDDAEAHGLLARALSADARYVPAVPHWERFLEAFPNDGGAWTGLGIALAGTQRVSEAVEAFRKAVASNPNDGVFHRNLARALITRGDVSEAETSARRAVGLSPRDAGSHAVLGQVLLMQGHQPEARAELNQALALDPNDPVANALLRLSPKNNVKR